MIALISFIAVIVGAINWFCIGLLQFDFVAGLFGSQSSIFSRLIYIVVGIGALVLLFNLIENKGKIKFNFKKKNTSTQRSEEKATTFYPRPQYSSVESGKDIDSEQLRKKTEEYKNHQDQNSCDNGSCTINTEETSTDTENKKID